MSRYVALLLFLAIFPWSFCRADYSDELESTMDSLTDTTPSVQPTKTPTAEPTPKPTTAVPTTKPTTAAPTTKPTTAAPTTKPTTAAPTTKPTTAAPTTKPTTAAPTTKPTTAAPTTKPTTAAPTTKPTTAAPTTPSSAPNTTTTAPTPTTTAAPPLPEPTPRLYEIKKGDDTCLMVKFGLRIGFYGAKYEEMNLDPNDTLTVVNGSCTENSSMLVIQAETLTLSLTFFNDTKKFSLHALNATGKLNSGVTFSESNNNLTLWQASLGNSYMCNKEQNYTISKNLAVFTFKLQVQPFGVKKNTFSTAQECSMDDTSILIPIVVGAALAGLILIVVIAYVIGRRKTYVGYQTL